MQGSRVVPTPGDGAGGAHGDGGPARSGGDDRPARVRARRARRPRRCGPGPS